MKRALLFTVVATGLCLGGFSVWTSLRAEAIHRQWISLLEARPEVRLIETHFQRGWLESVAETRFELRGAPGQIFQAPIEWAGRADVRKRLGFLVQQRTRHGLRGLLAWFQEGAVGSPYLALVQGTIELDQEAQSELTGAFGRLPAMRFRLPVRASGDVDGQISMAAGALRPRDVEPGEAPRWLGRFDGLHGQLSIRPAGAELRLEVRGLELIGEELLVRLADWKGHFDLGPLGTARRSKSEHEIALLQIEVGLEAADASSPPERSRLALENASWKIDAEPDESRITGRADAARWNLLDLQAAKLDASWPREADVDEGLAPTGLFGFLGELEIANLEGRLPSGPFHAAGMLEFPDRMPLPDGMPVGSIVEPAATNPDAPWVHGSLQLELPEAFVATLLPDEPDRLAEWIGTGSVAAMDGSLRTRLQWNASGWRANGQEIETRGWLDRLAPEPVLARPAGPLAEEELAADEDTAGERTEVETPEPTRAIVVNDEPAPKLPTIFDEVKTAPAPSPEPTAVPQQADAEATPGVPAAAAP